VNGLCPGQFIAFIGARSTQLGAGLAMFVLVLSAFNGTFHTNLGAYPAHVFRVGAVHAHQLCGGGTDGGALDVELGATYHHFEVFFVQIHGSAIIADGGRTQTGLDTIFVGLKKIRFHGKCFPIYIPKSYPVFIALNINC
jgi:hypothetical protein